MKPQGIVQLFKKTFEGLNPNEVPVQAAAIAFYMLLSLAPLGTISVAIAGLVLSQAVIENQLLEAIERLVGGPVAAVVESVLLANTPNSTTSGLLALVSFIFLVFAASTVFWQVRVSLNTTWGLVSRGGDANANYLRTITDRLLSVMAVLVVGLFLLAALLFSALAAGILPERLYTFLFSSKLVGSLLSLVISPTVYFLLFAAIFKWLPAATIRWRDVWPGAALTAVLFWLGGYLIWLYLLRSGVASIYGAAGSIVVFLLWIYASAWIFLFGAKFTQVYAAMFGQPIAPKEATLVTRHLRTGPGKKE